MNKAGARQILWPAVVAAVALVIGLCAGLVINGGGDATQSTAVVGTDVDIGFAQDMSAHHQQALMMCDMVPATAAPDVRGLADQIRTAQWREIGQMTGWLQMLDAPLQGEHPMSWMRGTEGHDHGGVPDSMPGTADGDELTALHGATGIDNEVLFLQLMIRHHQGAVAMVKSQSDEIAVMTVMLDQRGGQTLPYPV